MSRVITYPLVIPPAHPVYALVMDGSSLYNLIGSTFDPKATYASVTDWTAYATPMLDVSDGSDSHIVTAILPDSIPPGGYLIIVRSQIGVNAADSDPILGFFTQVIEAPIIPPTPDEDEVDATIGLITDEELFSKVNDARQIVVDNQTVIEHSLPDVIAADKYAANRKASGPFGGWNQVMKARAIPPSATGD